MEKRGHQRMEAPNILVDISDGWGFFSGTVSDLSRFGLQLDNVPKRLDDDARQMSLVVSTKDKNFKLRARPRWSKKKSISKSIGIEILNAPWGWTEFVMGLEPKNDDAWGHVRM